MTGVIQEAEYDLFFFVEIALDTSAVKEQDFLLIECQVDGDGGAYEA